MLHSEDLKFFQVVSVAASLAAAARTLDISPSAVTQRLSALERRVGVRLLNRSSRRLELTAEGRLLAECGARVLAEIDGIVDTLSRSTEMVSGHLRVAAPFGFGRRHVAPTMARLRAEHPDVPLTLSLFEDPIVADKEAWDVLIHVGQLADSELTITRLGVNRRILCAAPAYVARHGQPNLPNDLYHHTCAVIRENQDDATLWSFSAPGHAPMAVRVAPAMSSNDGAVIKQWVLAGLGVMVRSEWDVAEELKAGSLVELLPEWSLPAVDIVALFRSRSGRVKRTARFVQLLRTAMRQPSWKLPEEPVA
jgi:DNA-binding transcriptional LysR family regulator